VGVDPTKVLAGIPAGLRDPLLEEYRGLSDAYAQGRWKSASLDAGRFCEVVYSIIDGALSGSFSTAPSKPPNFPQSCRELENRAPIAVGDHALRLLIPRILVGMYDVRNNRNVGHVGGDVVANHMDATLVWGTASWVLAELIRIFHSVSTIEAQNSVDMVVERRVPLIWEIGSMRRVLDVKMSAREKALVLLYGQVGWVATGTLAEWAKYSNCSVFRTKVLVPLADELLVELDGAKDSAIITPLGTTAAEILLSNR
jgi:hypothetical protein